jgi:hypothetical protein
MPFPKPQQPIKQKKYQVMHPQTRKGESAMFKAMFKPDKEPAKMGRIETTTIAGKKVAYTEGMDQVQVKEYDGSQAHAIRAALKESLMKNKEHGENQEERIEVDQEVEEILDGLVRVMMRGISHDRMKLIDVDTLENREQLNEEERQGINMLVIRELLQELAPELKEIGFSPNISGDGEKGDSRLPHGRVFHHEKSDLKLVFHYAFDNDSVAKG